MKRSIKTIAMGLIACLAVLVITSGCQSAIKKVFEKRSGAEIESEKDKLLEVDTSDIPDEFIYPDSKAKSRIKSAATKGESIQVVFETSDRVDEVKKYYDEEPVSAGWKQELKIEQEQTMYTFSKNKSWVSSNISQENGKIQILVQYVEKIKE